MAKEIVLAGTQSYISNYFARKTSVATGAGQGGLTAGQTSASYLRVGAAAPVAVPLVAATLGTYSGSATQGALVAVATAAVPNSTGLYEFHPPSNAFAVGARGVTFFLSDAGNSDSWEPVQLQFQLVADDPSTRLFDVSTLTMTVVGSIGKRLLDTLDTNVASRLSPDGTLDRVTVVDLVAADGIGATAFTHAAVERIGDTLLRRDWTAITAEPATRSMWNALRFLRNAWSTTEIAGRIVVKRENDVTTAWDANLGTDAAATPIVSTDPTT